MYSEQLLNQFLNQVVLIAILNNWKSFDCAREVLLHIIVISYFSASIRKILYLAFEIED